MKLSTRSRYGLRAMVLVGAQGGENISIKSIAESLGLSEAYLEQLFSPLKTAGIIGAARGARGGYFLAKEPKDISVGDILRTLEGSLCPVECLEDGSDECHCGDNCGTRCVTKNVWERMYDGINNAVNAISLQHLISEYNTEMIK
ncbi:AsnC family transcriptional regulator [Clostridia bacterium]|nr:AsnC family transcriptional regulator [Clostridia bacterium]